jgi:DNA polymerase III subunit alpha
LDELAARCTRGVMVRVLEETHGPHKLEQLHEILRCYPGNCELQLVLGLADGSRVSCRCEKVRLAVNGEMRSRVDQLLGPGNVRLLAAPPTTSSGGGRPNGRSRRG